MTSWRDVLVMGTYGAMIVFVPVGIGGGLALVVVGLTWGCR